MFGVVRSKQLVLILCIGVARSRICVIRMMLQVSYGAGKVYHGTRKVSHGTGKVSHGAGKVSHSAGKHCR